MSHSFRLFHFRLYSHFDGGIETVVVHVGVESEIKKGTLGKPFRKGTFSLFCVTLAAQVLLLSSSCMARLIKLRLEILVLEAEVVLPPLAPRRLKVKVDAGKSGKSGMERWIRYRPATQALRENSSLAPCTHYDPSS